MAIHAHTHTNAWLAPPANERHVCVTTCRAAYAVACQLNCPFKSCCTDICPCLSCACSPKQTTACTHSLQSYFWLLKLAACLILCVANAAPAPGPMFGPASAPTGYTPSAPHYSTVPSAADCLSYRVCYNLITVSALSFLSTVGIMHALCCWYHACSLCCLARYSADFTICSHGSALHHAVLVTVPSLQYLH